MLKIQQVRIALMFVAGLFFAGSSFATDPVDPKLALEQRVVKYWEARQSRDIRTIYELESDSLPQGGSPDKVIPAVGGGLRVKNVKIDDIVIDGDRAKVQVKGNVLIGSMGWMPQTLVDNWVLIDGQWYHETKR